MEKRRYELHYFGRVQGVGFRYWTQSQGIKYHVSGWVRNEYDGSVTVQVQGSKEQIDNFMYGVEHGHRFIRIDRVEKIEYPLVPEERDFCVRY